MVQDTRQQSSGTARLYSLDEAVKLSRLNIAAIDLCRQSGVVNPVELERILHFSAKEILTLRIVYMQLVNRKMNASLKLCSAKLGIDFDQSEHASADGKGAYTELVDLILRQTPD
jgi:hypothetical protein